MRPNAKVPIHRLTRKEFEWRAKHYCKAHGHSYISHPNCYLRDNPQVDEKVGFLDLECSSLDANFGVILSWCLKLRNGKILYGVLNEKDFKEAKPFNIDKRIVKDLIVEILKLDRIVGHYSRKFDIPFLRCRALVNGLKFPSFGSIANDDTYYMAKFKLRLNSNRLQTVAQTLLGKSDKTHLDGNIWISAGRGNKKALSYILAHNKIDVIELERIWEILKDFVGTNKTSI
jgi:uncharacterized protein YprB with RNaseH-like and TPR domain